MTIAVTFFGLNHSTFSQLGTSKSYNLSSCVSLEGESRVSRVSSINTFGSCVKLYGDYNCSGNNNFIVKNDNNHDFPFYGFNVRAFGSCQSINNCTAANKIESRRTMADFTGNRGLTRK